MWHGPSPVSLKMSDPSHHPESQSQPPQEDSRRLNYISPRDDPERAARETLWFSVAAILTTIVVLILVLYWLLNNRYVGAAMKHPPPTYLGPMIATGLAVAILGGTALWQYTRHSSTAFAKGILIGLAIAALIEGFCFGFKMFK